MRLSLPVALIILLTSVLAEVDENASQRPFHNDGFDLHAHITSPSSHDSHPIITSTTLIDALSADGNYTRVIRLLQKARLVPTFNRLNGTTFFAPTNDAIEKDALLRAESDIGENEYDKTEDPFSDFREDNVNEKLRQQLLYHLLQSRLQELPKELKVHETYLYPRPNSSLTTDELNSTSPSPWIPVPGGTLGGQPQRIRVSSSDNKTWAATDFEGKGGVEIVRPLVEADNGALIGIADIIKPPPNLSE